VKIGVFVSGGGSNFTKIHEKILSSNLHVEVEFLLTNNSKCGGAAYARLQGIEVKHVSSKTHSEASAYNQAVLDACEGVDLIILAGFMKKLPGELISKFKDKIVNIHPALLPSFGGHGFYGSKVHEAVFKAGVRISGMTIHFVNEVYDTGDIIYQDSVQISGEDSPADIGAKVLKLEHHHFWQVVQGISLGKLSRNTDGRVVYQHLHQAL
tara:strand:- start:708 stop:1337 length:630 start_codon:yes stop_codon:yes gene_type:complete